MVVVEAVEIENGVEVDNAVWMWVGGVFVCV